MFALASKVLKQAVAGRSTPKPWLCSVSYPAVLAFSRFGPLVAVLGCAGGVHRAAPAEPCTIERALRDAVPDLRTARELCPAREHEAHEGDAVWPTPEELALAAALLGQLCEVDEASPLTCVAARSHEYDDLVENSASVAFMGAFTSIGARQALLAVGPLSVLFGWSGGKFSALAVLPELRLEPAQCLVVAPSKHVDEIACFERTLPLPHHSVQTVLDVHDLGAMQTTRVFAFSDTLLTSCGNVDSSLLLELIPGEVDSAKRKVAPSTLALAARYLITAKPEAYDRSCLDLLQRNWEMGPPVGDTAALLCSLPSYTETTRELELVDGAWQAVPDTEELLERLEVEGPWQRRIRALPTPGQ